MVRAPIGRRPAAAALALAATLHGIVALGAQPELILLDFWSPTCGPCMQMKPTVEALINARYPIRQVNVSQESELARQYGVTGIPCFVMLVDGREVDRVVGATSSNRLQQMFTRAKEVVDTQRRVRGQSQDQPPTPQAAVDQVSSEPPLPQQLNAKLLSSSVRLTLDDAKGRSHGTGTIIDARKGEALLITCGHIFRESKGQGPVRIELYESGPQGLRVVETVEGRVLSYDLERDVAFVSFRPTHPVCVAVVAPPRTAIAKGDLASSVGCNNGDDPTVVATRITSLDKYQGFPNIEASGVPVVGRSGGGLFNDNGQIVGVCIGADYEGNRGLYAGLESIHEELSRLGLEDVYAKSAGGALPADAASDLAPIAAGPIVRGQELPANMPQGVESAVTPAAATAVSPDTPAAAVGQNLSPNEHAALEEIVSRAAKRTVTCIIQPETPGGEVEVITIENVSDEFVRALANRQKAGTATR
jgi:thiol-disulfide isomerase/thioredoxin